MKKFRFTDHQILAVLKQAEAGTPVPHCTAAWHQHGDVLQDHDAGEMAIGWQYPLACRCIWRDRKFVRNLGADIGWMICD
jgi:hypothetical protein